MGKVLLYISQEKKYITNIEKEYFKNKLIHKNFIKKVNKNKFILKFQKKFITVLTN